MGGLNSKEDRALISTNKDKNVYMSSRVHLGRNISLFDIKELNKCVSGGCDAANHPVPNTVKMAPIMPWPTGAVATFMRAKTMRQAMREAIPMVQ